MTLKVNQPEAVTQPEVSIIIVNWNAGALLRDCLESIATQTKLSHEIIVIDNASSDDSTEMLRSEFGDVALIANSVNRGFAAANNQGIAQASGRLVLLLNPDTVILDGAIDTMVQWFDDHPDVGCVGCQVYKSESALQRTCFRDLSLLNLIMGELSLHRSPLLPALLGRAEYAGWDRCSERDVDVVSGMFILTSRAVIDAVGVLDESFFVYAEEADWCRRVRRAGSRCVFSPVARILHHDGGCNSTSQVKPRMYVQLQKSKLLLIRKHNGLISWLLANVILVLSMTIRCVILFSLGALTRNQDHTARARLASAALRFHLLRAESIR